MTQTDHPSPPGILETSLYSTDLDRAEAFYAGIMGLEVVLSKPGRHVFFRCRNSMLLIFCADATLASGDPGRPGHLAHGARGPGHVCFAATDSAITMWRQHFSANGIAIEDDFRWPNGARSLYLRDPDGNSLEFAEPGLWGFSPDDPA